MSTVMAAVATVEEMRSRSLGDGVPERSGLRRVQGRLPEVSAVADRGVAGVVCGGDAVRGLEPVRNGALGREHQEDEAGYGRQWKFRRDGARVWLRFAKG